MRREEDFSGEAPGAKDVFEGTARRKRRSNSSSVASAPILSAISMNRFDCSPSAFGFRGIDGLAVGEPLAHDTTDQAVSTRLIADAASDPVVVAEIKFSEVAMQVGLAAMLVDANDTDREDR